MNTITQELNKISTNLALVDTDDQRTAISEIFNQRIEKKKQLQSELDHLQKKAKPTRSSDSEVDQVMQIVDKLTKLAEQPEDFSKAKEIFDLTNLRMFFRFEPKKLAKRTVNKLVGGIVVFGDADAPVKLYQGPTSSKILKEESRKKSKKQLKTNQNTLSSGDEDKSLRNVSRDDRAVIELFLEAIQSWNSAMWKRLPR